MKIADKDKLPPSLVFLVSHGIVPKKVAINVLGQANGKTPITLLEEAGYIDSEEADLASMCDVSPRKRLAAQSKYAAMRAARLTKELHQLATVIHNSDGGV